MPLERQKRVLRYRQNSDRKMCIIAYLILMYGLKKEHGIEKPPGFIYNEHGKPYLAEHPHIFFNISHCKAGVVCVLSEDEVGIDMQEIRPFDIDVAKRVCQEYELEDILRCNSPERYFCKLWTIKESFVKLHGGSAIPFSSFDARSLSEQLSPTAVYHWGKEYHICCFGMVGEGKICKIEPHQLF